MYHPTTRVLAVLELLQAHGRLSGPDLAGRLEVDLRTVRRYVTMLQDLGIPVEAERGRYGGYRLRPGFTLPPLMLTDDEALAVTLGLLTARRLGLGIAAPAVEGALAKVERVLPPGVRGRVAAVQDALTIDLPARPEAPPSATLVGLSEAAHAGNRVKLRYASAQGVETERCLDPYGLAFIAGRWYAAGWCHLRADLRLFRLDRVLAIDATEEQFTRPPDFDCLEFVRASLARAPGIWRVEAVLDLAIEEAERWIPAHLATIAPNDGGPGVLICLQTDCLQWVARFLIGLGCPFTVRRPGELGEVLRDLAGQLIVAAGEHPTA